MTDIVGIGTLDLRLFLTVIDPLLVLLFVALGLEILDSLLCLDLLELELMLLLDSLAIELSDELDELFLGVEVVELLLVGTSIYLILFFMSLLFFLERRVMDTSINTRSRWCSVGRAKMVSRQKLTLVLPVSFGS